jgi:hypothetical protein
MVERIARDQLIELLGELAAGRLTKDQFVARRPRSKDRAVGEISSQAWLLFDDARGEGRAGAFQLPRDDRRDLDRWILFLQSGKEYEWPALPAWARILGFVPSVLTFGLFWRPYRFWFERQGDFRVWPFHDRGELNETRRLAPNRGSRRRR